MLLVLYIFVVDPICLFCELQAHLRGKRFTNTPLHYSRKSKDTYIIIIIIIIMRTIIIIMRTGTVLTAMAFHKNQ